MTKSAKKSNKKEAKKAPKQPKKTTTRSGKMNFFQKIAYRRRVRREAYLRKRAEAKAKLPKEPVKRFFAKLNPKYWFNRHTLWVFCKIIFACILLGIIGLGGLFVYYKNELKDIELGNLTISETVNTYLDRNGVVLWEDVGNEDYRLVVKGEEISMYMRQATVAIEDKNFYNHPGVDLSGLVRATISTLTGKGVQGGSTLTQQLIKQLYFSDEAASENRGGISRKIKELILALELEKMYDKEEIITMYLNESPYGGRRNGVESAAQTYFGKTAKELDLAESALLASIPNNPAILDPYYEYGNEGLIERQHKTLDSMAELGYITEEEAEAAKAIDILATIKPETSQYAGIKAPHFVLEVKKQLEEKYGIATMRAGGFTIKTTLDYNAQKIAEESVTLGYNTYAYLNKSDNAALVSVDVETAQVIAMVGSVNFNIPGYGEVNATTSELEPGSSIKPILDYAPLFVEREGINFGPGTVLVDENIDKIYCNGNTRGCALRNYSGRFYGRVTIRQALAGSLNIPAAKALIINGIDDSLEIAHGLGDKNYCANNENAGYSMGIGSGCTVIPVEHANAYASIARGGVYKDLAYVLEVKNSSGETLESWEDSEGVRVVDEQVAYMISSILSDASARVFTFGSQANSFGFVVPGVWTATKTGTTTTASSSVAKDQWTLSYSTAIATAVWNGNHDGRGMSSSSSNVSRRIAGTYMERVHKEVYAPEGKWSSGDQPVKPSGIHTATVNGKTDIWPSWYDSKKSSGVTNEKLDFNKYNGKLAASCTNPNYKVSIEVTKTVDPMTKTATYNAPAGYDPETEDDCSYVYVAPQVSTISQTGDTIKFTITKGSANLKAYTINIAGKDVYSHEASSGTVSYTIKDAYPAGTSIKVTVSDAFDNYATTTGRTANATGTTSGSSNGSSTNNNSTSSSSE